MSVEIGNIFSQNVTLYPKGKRLHSCPQLNTLLGKIHTGIGQTTLLPVLIDAAGGGIFAKLEFENKYGTVKDRPAFWLLVKALQRYASWEEAKEKCHVLEYSGGSLAFSISRMCQEIGLKNTLVLGSWMGDEAFAVLRNFGSEVIVVPKEKGFLEVILETKKIAEKYSGYDFLFQHENFANLLAHQTETGSEILTQLADRIPHAWVASIGTGATLVGVAQALRTANKDLAIHAVTPEEQPYGTMGAPNGLRKFAGSGGLGFGIKQPFIELSCLPIRHWSVAFAEVASKMVSLLSIGRLRLGSSSAANFIVAEGVYRELGEGTNVVTVFPSAGTEEEWRYVRSI